MKNLHDLQIDIIWGKGKKYKDDTFWNWNDGVANNWDKIRKPLAEMEDGGQGDNPGFSFEISLRILFYN